MRVRDVIFEDRRGLFRRPPVDIRASSPSLEFVVVNFHAAGLAVESREAPRIGGTVLFNIRRGKRAVKTAGKVVWCHLKRVEKVGGGETVAYYRAGIEFKPGWFSQLRSNGNGGGLRSRLPS